MPHAVTSHIGMYGPSTASPADVLHALDGGGFFLLDGDGHPYHVGATTIPYRRNGRRTDLQPTRPPLAKVRHVTKLARLSLAHPPGSRAKIGGPWVNAAPSPGPGR